MSYDKRETPLRELIGGRPHADSLDQRGRGVLLAVVRSFIALGEPVGSSSLRENSGWDVSPATIRSIMVALTRAGYLSQPHTSAGRVPTEKGYRYYVDVLDAEEPETEALEAAFADPWTEITALMGRTSSLLARLSDCVGVVVAPRFTNTLFRHLKFIKLEGSRVVAVLETESGLVHDKVVNAGEDFPASELDRIATYLSNRFSGMTLRDVREVVARELQEEQALADRAAYGALSLAGRSLAGALDADEVYYDGTARCLRRPEFAHVDAIRALLEALEAKDRMVRLLDRCLAEDHSVRVLIGSENGMEDLQDFSIVAARYTLGDRTLGTLGVVGPTRMAYGRVLPAVQEVARHMSRALAEAYT